MRDHELHELRRELAKVPRGHGIYYPDSLRGRVRDWAFRRKEEGATWPAIAAEIGVAHSTLRLWIGVELRRRRALEKPTASLVPVEIVGAARDVATVPTVFGALRTTSVSVVSPGGFRVEGLTLDEAIAALERLG
jgi:transposase